MKRLVGGIALGIVAAVSLAACGLGLDEAALSNANTAAPAQPGAGPNGEENKPPTIETKTGLPCDVDDVLKKRCQTCHAPNAGFGTSTSLVTWDDLQKVHPSGKRVFELVKDRIHNQARPMPPSPRPMLEAGELAVLDSWLDKGAASSDATCTNEVPPDAVKPLSCKADTVLKARKPFNLQGGDVDQYVCFGVDVSLEKKRHVVGFAPKVDNKQIVHHILLFQTNAAESPEPFPCEAFGSASWKLVAGWAPGGNNLELPKEAGFPQEKGTTHWVLQIHYNTTVAKTGMDQSGYELCTTEDLRPNDAGVLAFGAASFSIPPRSTHTIRCDYRLGSEFANRTLFNASPHMHTRGVSMSTERLAGGNGAPEMVFEQKNFSFEAQANYPIAKTVTTGDVLRTRCTWKNPGDTSIGFGEGTNDEMCFDFLGYYPAIPDRVILGVPLFTWITPSLNASCTKE